MEEKSYYIASAEEAPIAEPEEGIGTETVAEPEEGISAETVAEPKEGSGTETSEQPETSGTVTEPADGKVIERENREETETEETSEGTIQQIQSFISSHAIPIGIGAGVLILILIGVIIKIRMDRKRIQEKKRLKQLQREKEEERLRKAEENEMHEAEAIHAHASESCGSTLEDIETPAVSQNSQKSSGIYMSSVHRIGRRKEQQDSFGVSQSGNVFQSSGKGLLAIVADGMGGLSNGAQVSAKVIMTMMESFEHQPALEKGDTKLLNMLNDTNNAVNAMLKGNSKSGSTLLAALIQKDELFWLTVGDSHMYLYRDGALMQINRDHVYGVVLDEKAARGEISHQEAASDPQRKALTSYIGMGHLRAIDRNIRGLKLVSGDRVLLMSDGVFGTLTDEEITAAMKLPVEESCVALEQMIEGKNRPVQDNYTALILEYI